MVDIAAGGNHNKDQFDEYNNEFGSFKMEIEEGVVTSMNDLDLFT